MTLECDNLPGVCDNYPHCPCGNPRYISGEHLAVDNSEDGTIMGYVDAIIEHRKDHPEKPQTKKLFHEFADVDELITAKTEIANLQKQIAIKDKALIVARDYFIEHNCAKTVGLPEVLAALSEGKGELT